MILYALETQNTLLLKISLQCVCKPISRTRHSLKKQKGSSKEDVLAKRCKTAVPCANADAVGHSLWRRHEAKAQALGTMCENINRLSKYITFVEFDFSHIVPMGRNT